MAEQKTGGEVAAVLESSDFKLTSEQQDELRSTVISLFVSFEKDKNLIEDFLKYPYSYLMGYHEISFLKEMVNKNPELVFSFDEAIKRLKIEIRESRGNCLACILSSLAIIYGGLLHYGHGIELLKSIAVEITITILEYFKITDESKDFIDEILKMSVVLSPISLAKKLCRMLKLCSKQRIEIDVDTIGGSLTKLFSNVSFDLDDEPDDSIKSDDYLSV